MKGRTLGEAREWWKQVRKLALFRGDTTAAMVEPLPNRSDCLLGAYKPDLELTRGASLAQVERSISYEAVSYIDVGATVTEFEFRLVKEAQLHRSSSSENKSL